MSDADKPDVCWSSVAATDASRVVIARAQALHRVYMRNYGQYEIDKLRQIAEAQHALMEACEDLNDSNHAVRKANGEL
jgi:hypothetical protein